MNIPDQSKILEARWQSDCALAEASEAEGVTPEELLARRAEDRADYLREMREDREP